MVEDEFPPERDASGRLLMKRCPDCAELVQAEARICRYCRFDFDAGIDAGEVERADPGEPRIEPAEPEMPKEESEADSDGLTEDELATFAIFAAAAKKATDPELADLLMGFPSETSIQHRAIVAEQARRRDVPLPQPLTVPDVGQPQPVAVPVPVAVSLPGGVQLSSAGRRLGAYALDVLLFVVTLFIGWLVWSLIVWGRGQSPAKQLLHMRVVYLRNGAHVSWGRMAFREVIGKGAVAIAASITVIGYILYFWLLWDDKRQELWDKMADTVVVDDPRDILA